MDIVLGSIFWVLIFSKQIPVPEWHQPWVTVLFSSFPRGAQELLGELWNQAEE